MNIRKGASMDNEVKLLSMTEAAAYLGITRQSMHEIATRNGIGRRIGNAWAFTQAELDAWLDKPRPRGGRPPKSGVRATTPAVLV